MKQYLLILVAVALFSCNRNGNEAANETDDSTHRLDTGLRDGTLLQTDSLPRTANRPKPANLEFDLTGFMQFSDSLVSVISGQETKFRYVISNRIDTNKAYYRILNPSSAEKVQQYRLLPHKGAAGVWDVTLIRIKYKSEANAEKVYDGLEWLSKQKNTVTGRNEYIFHSGDELVWLQLPCRYNETNLERMKTALMKNLKNNDPQKTVSCICDGGCK